VAVDRCVRNGSNAGICAQAAGGQKCKFGSGRKIQLLDVAGVSRIAVDRIQEWIGSYADHTRILYFQSFLERFEGPIVVARLSVYLGILEGGRVREARRAISSNSGPITRAP
jgi:hypothetical protein